MQPMHQLVTKSIWSVVIKQTSGSDRRDAAGCTGHLVVIGEM